MDKIRAGIREIDARQPDGPVYPQAPTPGDMLGEEARLALVAAFQPHVDVPGWWVDQVAPVVAALVAQARADGAVDGDRAARLDIWEALMQPGANAEARRNGFTGREGAAWAMGYVAGKLEASRISIADDEEWRRLAAARAEREGRT